MFFSLYYYIKKKMTHTLQPDTTDPLIHALSSNSQACSSTLRKGGKMEDRLEELMSILLEQEAALFTISAQDINEPLLASLQQAKAANKKAQDKLREIIIEGSHEKEEEEGMSSPASSFSFSPSSSPITSPSFTQSAPTSPISRLPPSSSYSSSTAPSSSYTPSSSNSLSLSMNHLEAPPLSSSSTTKKLGRSLTVRGDRTMFVEEGSSSGGEEGANRPKDLKRRGISQFFSIKSKSAFNLSSNSSPDDPSPPANYNYNSTLSPSTMQRLNSTGRQKITLSYSAAEIFRRRKDKPKKKEEVDNYFQMYESSKMLFEKKRELLKSSTDTTKPSEPEPSSPRPSSPRPSSPSSSS